MLTNPNYTQIGIGHEIFEDENYIVVIMANKYQSDEPEVPLPEGDLSELKKAFDILDANGTQKLDMVEIKKAMDNMRFYQTDPDLYSILKELGDSDKCSWPKFAFHVYGCITDRNTDEGLRTLFDLFIDDPEKDTITLDTFRRICKEVGENMSDEELRNILEITTQSGNDISFEDFFCK